MASTSTPRPRNFKRLRSCCCFRQDPAGDVDQGCVLGARVADAVGVNLDHAELVGALDQLGASLGRDAERAVEVDVGVVFGGAVSGCCHGARCRQDTNVPR
jgi:hypothetical protein